MNPLTQLNYTSNSYQNSNKKNLIRLALIFLFLIFMYLVVYSVYLKPKTADQVASSFMSEIYKKNDPIASYALVSSIFKSGTSLDEWKTNVNNTYNFCSGTISKKNETLDTNTAVITFTVKGNSLNCNASVNLSKTGNKWQVDYFVPME